MTWQELSQVQRYAARHSIDQRDRLLCRTACSRAYYSAYAAITARLPPGILFGHGWQNPAHAALPGLVDQLPGLSAAKKGAIRVALSQLRQRREDADYRPGVTVDRTAARESWRGPGDHPRPPAVRGPSMTKKKRVTKASVVRSVQRRLDAVGHGIEFQIVDAGVRADGDWWTVPVLSRLRGQDVRRDVTVSIFATVENDLHNADGLTVLLVPVVD